MFEKVVVVFVDFILGLIEEFKKDFCIDKINFGVGIYKNEVGEILVFVIVKKVEVVLFELEKIKFYFMIEGIVEYGLVV